MKDEKALSGNFTEGSIGKKLIQFMVPILRALVLQAMYGAVDLLVVGQFGSEAGISGVATGSNIINMVNKKISLEKNPVYILLFTLNQLTKNINRLKENNVQVTGNAAITNWLS